MNWSTPTCFLSLAREHVTFYILQAKGPGTTRIDCHFLFAPHEMELMDFDPSDVVDFWRLVNRQDWAICARVQQGMSACVHERGVYAPMENWNLDIHLDQLFFMRPVAGWARYRTPIDGL